MGTVWTEAALQSPPDIYTAKRPQIQSQQTRSKIDERIYPLTCSTVLQGRTHSYKSRNRQNNTYTVAPPRGKASLLGASWLKVQAISVSPHNISIKTRFERNVPKHFHWSGHNPRKMQISLGEQGKRTVVHAYLPLRWKQQTLQERNSFSLDPKHRNSIS